MTSGKGVSMVALVLPLLIFFRMLAFASTLATLAGRCSTFSSLSAGLFFDVTSVIFFLFLVVTFLGVFALLLLTFGSALLFRCDTRDIPVSGNSDSEDDLGGFRRAPNAGSRLY